MKKLERRQKLNLLVGLACFACQNQIAFSQNMQAASGGNSGTSQVQLGLPVPPLGPQTADPIPASPWDRTPASNSRQFQNSNTTPATSTPASFSNSNQYRSTQSYSQNNIGRAPNFIEQPSNRATTAPAYQRTEFQPQQFNSQPQQFNAQPQQFNAQPQQFNAQPQQFNSQPQQFNAQPQQFNAQPQQFNAQPQQFSTQPQQLNAQPESMNAIPNFEINAPLSTVQQPTVFRMASNAQVNGYQAAAQNAPVNPSQNWNTIPASGVPMQPELQVAPAAMPVAHPQNPALGPLTTAAPMVAPSQASAISDDTRIGATLASTSQPAAYQVEQNRRTVVAQQVSARLLSNGDRKGPAPRPIEPPRGWNAIQEELVRHYRACDELLRRGAVQSAREEALTGLRCLCRALDSREMDRYSESALDRAMTAFLEERDFYSSHSSTPGDAMIAGHSTPVLKNQSLGNVAPLIAAQHYRAYARYQLICASQGFNWAADLCYALGKTYEAQSEQEKELSMMYRERAIACYQAALTIQKNHAQAANQLGYSLLKVDRPSEAQVALAAAVNIAPTPAAWKNLAEVYRRNGDTQNASQAVQQAVALEQNVERMSNGQPMPSVVELSPEQFAQMSPNVMGSPNSTWNQQLYPNASAGPVGNRTATTASLPTPQQPPVKTSKMDAIKNFFR